MKILDLVLTIGLSISIVSSTFSQSESDVDGDNV